jgi:hypothetical protein
MMAEKDGFERGHDLRVIRVSKNWRESDGRECPKGFAQHQLRVNVEAATSLHTLIVRNLLGLFKGTRRLPQHLMGSLYYEITLQVVSVRPESLFHRLHLALPYQ